MKNSLYVNSMNINISEMARLTFQEQMPQHNNNLEHVVTICCHVEFLKELHSVIGKTLFDHAENIANIDKNKDVN